MTKNRRTYNLPGYQGPLLSPSETERHRRDHRNELEHGRNWNAEPAEEPADKERVLSAPRDRHRSHDCRRNHHRRTFVTWERADVFDPNETLLSLLEGR